MTNWLFSASVRPLYWRGSSAADSSSVRGSRRFRRFGRCSRSAEARLAVGVPSCEDLADQTGIRRGDDRVFLLEDADRAILIVALADDGHFDAFDRLGRRLAAVFLDPFERTVEQPLGHARVLALIDQAARTPA